MSLTPNAVASLILSLSIVLLPATLTGCGGDRYSCDNCEASTTDNPEESDAEDPSELLESTSLNLIESAKFTATELGNPATMEDFSNYTKIDLRFGTYSKASLIEFDEDNPQGNLMPISAGLWDDDIDILEWGDTKSDLADNKLRSYYELTSAGNTAGWTLVDDDNQHELRVYDNRIYEDWLGWTIKWEVFRAEDKGYPDIAGERLTILASTDEFAPPIISDEAALQSVLLWGQDTDFTDGTDAEKAGMFVIYKQFRPVDKEGNNVALDWVALVPEVANAEGSDFTFTPLSTDNSLDNFIAAHSSINFDARIKVNEKLYISFNIGGAGIGSGGADLWDSKTATFSVPVDYESVVASTGIYIRIYIPMASKAAYGLETYENPIFALITDGVNDGIHLGWLYERSGEIAEDLPQPHYAFNDVALSDMQAAFKQWRRETYCEDSDHRDDPNRDTICSTLTTP